MRWWCVDAEPEEILSLLTELLETNKHYPNTTWTGFRILGTVSRANGQIIYTLELFSKGKDSKTKVYSGFNAPNVKLESGNNGVAHVYS